MALLKAKGIRRDVANLSEFTVAASVLKRDVCDCETNLEFVSG